MRAATAQASAQVGGDSVKQPLGLPLKPGRTEDSLGGGSFRIEREEGVLDAV